MRHDISLLYNGELTCMLSYAITTEFDIGIRWVSV